MLVWDLNVHKAAELRRWAAARDWLTIYYLPPYAPDLNPVGGRIVYATGAYEGLDEPIPAISPTWSPVAHFGGYQATVKPGISGARQADMLGQAVAESEQHRQWRAARGFTPEAPAEVFDTCFVL